MSAKKINQARNMAELESLFWLSMGDGEEAAKAACKRYAEDLSSTDPAVKLTAASNINMIYMWAMAELGEVKAVNLLPEGVNSWTVKSIADGEGEDADVMEEAAHKEVFKRATENAPRLFTDGKLSGPMKQDVDDVQAAYKALEKSAGKQDQINNLTRAIGKGDFEPARAEAISRAYQELFSRPYHGSKREAKKEAEALRLAIYTQRQQEVKDYDASSRELYKNLISALEFTHREITPMDSRSWRVSNVSFTDTAQEAIQANNERGWGGEYIESAAAMYPVLTEFYRITGGKILSISLNKTNDRASAFCSGTTAGSINIGGHPNRTTMYHEMAHLLEGDGLTAAASRHFRNTSANGPEIKKLNEISNNEYYKDEEVALENGWISPYVGKVYKNGHTEVLSMGLQHLAHPDQLARLAATDPAMLEYVLAVAAAPAASAVGVVRALADDHRKINEEFFEKLDGVIKSTKWHSVSEYGGKLYQPIKLKSMGWYRPWYYTVNGDGTVDTNDGRVETAEIAKAILILSLIEHQKTGEDVSQWRARLRIKDKKAPRWFKSGDKLELKSMKQ